MATEAEKSKNLADFKAMHSHISGGQQTTWMNLLGARILNVPVKREIDGKETNLYSELRWLPTNFRNVLQAIAAVGKQVAEVLELLKQIAAAQKVTIDTDAVANATAEKVLARIETIETERTNTSINFKELPQLEDLGEVK